MASSMVDSHVNVRHLVTGFALRPERMLILVSFFLPFFLFYFRLHSVSFFFYPFFCLF